MVAMGRQQRLMPTSPFTASTAATRLLCPIQVKRSAGVEFIDNGTGPGVRLRKRATNREVFDLRERCLLSGWQASRLTATCQLMTTQIGLSR